MGSLDFTDCRSPSRLCCLPPKPHAVHHKSSCLQRCVATNGRTEVYTRARYVRAPYAPTVREAALYGDSGRVPGWYIQALGLSAAVPKEYIYEVLDRRPNPMPTGEPEQATWI